MRRFDVYGFRDLDLAEAAAFVESAAGVRMWLRDSSYRGIYYCAGEGAKKDFDLETNEEGASWYSRFPEYRVILMVNDVPDMDAIREKLTAGREDPVFLRSRVLEDPPPDDDEDDDGEEE